MYEAQCFNSFHSWGANVVIKLGQWKPRKRKKKKKSKIHEDWKLLQEDFLGAIITSLHMSHVTRKYITIIVTLFVLIFLLLNPFGMERGTSANEMETRK